MVMSPRWVRARGVCIDARAALTEAARVPEPSGAARDATEGPEARLGFGCAQQTTGKERKVE
eukprot:1589818-Pyramimonas_sp.AAC.1